MLIRLKKNKLAKPLNQEHIKSVPSIFEIKEKIKKRNEENENNSGTNCLSIVKK
jgi:hypothetical protein